MRNLEKELADLRVLFSCLPSTLPINPADSLLNFELDSDLVAEEGWGVEFNHRMEVAWRSWKGPIQIQERGSNLDQCLELLKLALEQIDGPLKQVWVGGWIDKLREAAISAGSVLRSPATSYISISDDSDDSNNLDDQAPQAINVQSCPSDTDATGWADSAYSENDSSDSSDSDSDHPGSSHGTTITSEQPSNSTRGSGPLRQTKLSFKKVDRETYQEQCARQAEILRASLEARKAAAAARAEREQEERKVKDKLRKQRDRAQAKAEDIRTGRRSADGRLVNNKPKPTNEQALDLDIERAQRRVVRASRAQKKQNKESKEKPEVAKPRTRICWQAPAYWVHILGAVKAEGFEYASQHPSSVITRLRLTHRDSGMFDGLHKGVLRRWFTRDEDGAACWKKDVLAQVEKESGRGGTGKSKKLADYPEVLEGFKDQLRALRHTSVPISCSIARSILIAHMRIHAPDVDESFSDRWMHKLLEEVLGWSYRKGTKAGRKRPHDWEDRCLLTFLRISRSTLRYNIKSPRMIVNADQTGVSLFPLGNKTWEARGSKQVPTHNHEEKRQYTLVVASSNGGDILPFQSVWGGSTPASLPSQNASRRQEADSQGFTYAHGDTRHWSSLETTKAWVVEILVPYLDRVRKEEGLPAKSKAILYIDCWPVHTAKSDDDCFIPWMAKNHPEIVLLFVPAGCTGEFQPADTLLQRIIKHLIKTAALDFFIAWSTRLLKNGSKPENVNLPSDLPTLRNASIAWTLEAYYYLKKRPEIVRKSWEKCRTGSWDLSWEKLTSPEATELFFATAANNAAFRDEGRVARAAEGEGPIECGDIGDDLSLSPEQLVAALTGVVNPVFISNEEGAFQRHGDESDIENTPTSSQHPNYPIDIAVLGGTHPAALEDLSARVLKSTLNSKRASKVKKKVANQSSNKQAKGTSTNPQVQIESNGTSTVALLEGSLTGHTSKRPRRETVSNNVVDTVGEVRDKGSEIGQQKGKRLRV